MITIGSTFSGYGGLDSALAEFTGGRTVWHVENDPQASKILAHHHPEIPNYGDITRVDWASVEPVDWLTAGFPCQDLSHAGKRAGMRPGTRSGLWFHVAYAIDQLRPRHVLLENVRGLLSGRADRDMGPDSADVEEVDPGAVRALGVVLGDLANLGYDCRWVCVRAADAGAPHGRARVFIVATDTDSLGCKRGGSARRRVRGPTDNRVAAPDISGGAETAPNPGGTGLEGRWTEPVGDDPKEPTDCGAAAAHANRDGQQSIGWVQPVGRDAHGCGSEDVAWGAYEFSITRWERTLGRSAPRPTEPGRNGERLSPKFVEFMMGLPDGWVTDVPDLPRNAQLKALGNGVVPAQALLALRMLVPHLAAERVA